MRRLLALLTCASLLTGCATTGATRVQTPASPVDPGLLASYVKQLPIGSRVRVDRTNGHTLKGTLMKTTDTSIVVQRRTRVPEPPEDLPLATVAAVQIDNGGGTGRALWVGAAAGAGGALAVFLILAAIFAGD